MTLHRLKGLLTKTIDTLKEDGLGTFLKKVVLYTAKTLTREKSSSHPDKTFMDVLFINGCYLPHPSRYRVNHQREQLYANGIVSNVVFFEDLTLELVKNYRMFVFFRCPSTDIVMDFIKKAKSNNKVVLFDIDDLVVDTKYTDTIKHIQAMSPDDRRNYEDGVNRMQKVLRMCDAAITTTEALADELRDYVSEVFVNRNTASERMVELSQKASKEKAKCAENGNGKTLSENFVRIGYFSGSITHNADIELILPVIIRIMEKHANVYFHFAGELDIPYELNPFRDRIVATPFEDWEKLPAKIISVDINIAPLEDTLFNQAKSENKWVEAALVKVPTVASNVGAMARMIQNGETGILCAGDEEWFKALDDLVTKKDMRQKIANASYEYVIKHCITLRSGYSLAKYVKSKMTPNIAFIVPSVQISGGILVVLKHCLMLRKQGLDVLLVNESVGSKNVIKEGQEIPVISRQEIQIHGSFDNVVATLWSTLDFIMQYPNIKERFYLVQNFETDFYPYGQHLRLIANQTYRANWHSAIRYLTISKWCQNWLKDDFEQEATYAPNGLDTDLFQPRKRVFEGRIRILVEGNSDDNYKNVDESFRIVEKLDHSKFEIWYMSYQGEPKKWYHIDKYLRKVPYEEVPEVYHACHILLKSSKLESFSYPPLEMMSTGGFAVVAPNEGNIEYLRDSENCILYKPGDLDSAVHAIYRICQDEALRDCLFTGGVQTARSRSWDKVEEQILNLYGVIPRGVDE